MRRLCEEINRGQKQVPCKENFVMGAMGKISSDNNVRSCKQRRVHTISDERYLQVFMDINQRKIKLRYNTTNSNGSSITWTKIKMKSKVVSMCLAAVKVRHFHSGNEIHTYAVLGCSSQGTFINTDSAQKLKAGGIKTTIKIKILKGENT